MSLLVLSSTEGDWEILSALKVGICPRETSGSLIAGAIVGTTHNIYHTIEMNAEKKYNPQYCPLNEWPH